MNHLKSAQDPAAAAASVYLLCPCHGICHRLFNCSLYITVLILVLYVHYISNVFTGLESFRRMLILMKIGALQYAILKTVLSVLSIILWTNGNFDLSDVSTGNGTPTYRIVLK